MGCVDFDESWTKFFDPDCHNGYYWWSYTDFSGHHAEVPYEYLGLLIDGHLDGIKRNLKYYPEWKQNGFPRVKIFWNPRTKRWRVRSAFTFSEKATAEWMERHNGNSS